jgi:hypothetical protein
MANLADKKTLGAPAAQSVEVVRVKYDFSKDAGAVGNMEVFEADKAMVVKCRGVHVSTALTSGGSATISLGKGAAGTEFLSASAVAGFSLGAAVQPASHNAVKLAAGEKIHIAIGTAALTAGVADIVLEIGAF